MTNSLTLEVITDFYWTKKFFFWSLQDFKEDGLVLEVKFNNPEYISMIKVDQCKVSFSNANYFLKPKDQEMKAIPNNFNLQKNLPTQSYDLPSEETVETITSQG